MKFRNISSNIANIKLVMTNEKKGTCTLSGITYDDLRSILTEADLYIYKERKIEEDKLENIDAKNRNAKYELQHQVETLEYLEEKQHLIKRLDELVKHCINLTHNPKTRFPIYEEPNEETFQLHTRIIADKKLQEIDGTTPIIPPPKEYKEHYCRTCDGNGHNPIWKCEKIGCDREYEALCYEHFD